MNNRVDITLPRSAWLGLSAHTEARFQTWMQQALASMAVSPSELTEEQTAVVTIITHARDESAPQAPTVTSTHQATHFPDTTCTLHWQSGRWGIASLSSLTRIEEVAPPCCEHAFWFGQETVGYQLQWAPMRHETLVIALRAWEQQLSSMPALLIQVSLALNNQEHDTTLFVCP